MANPKILICGASIAGPCVAYWLLQGGDPEITIVERAPSLRINGQSIDIRNSAVTIMQKMGIEDEVRSKSTNEKGIAFVTAKGKNFAVIEATGDTNQQSFTSEFEIFRGDLSEIMYNRVKGKVQTIFGDYIAMMRQESDGDGVYVEFANGTKPQKYDLVIGADGLGSKTRSMAFNTTTREHLKPLLCYFAYYTMDEDLLKGDDNAIVHSSSRGRVFLLRPDPNRVTRANLGIVFSPDRKGREGLDRILAAEKQGPTALKDELAKAMRGTGFNMEEKVIKGMYDAQDFYSSEVAQIRTDKLFEGRVVLLGDAAYCPTPMTGMGTSLAMIGSYVLAGELTKHRGNISAALQGYQDTVLPIAREVQKLSPGMPRPSIPQTQWGVYFRNLVLWLFVTFRLDRIVARLASFIAMGDEKFPLPDYTWKSHS